MHNLVGVTDLFRHLTMRLKKLMKKGGHSFTQFQNMYMHLNQMEHYGLGVKIKILILVLAQKVIM